VFGPVLESSGCSPRLSGLLGDVVDNARVSSWRDCFMVALLGDDAFPHGDEVDGLAYPQHWPMTHSCLPRG
jgi:hypothetical protein